MTISNATQKHLGEALARCQVAREFPRNLEQVRTKLLLLCSKPSFARTAVYQKPGGGERVFQGLSIRFAEEALPIFKNLHVAVAETQDGPSEQTWVVSVTDLESNIVLSEEVVIQKLAPKEVGRTEHGTIMQMSPLDADEFHALRLSVCARMRRTLILQNFPHALRAECLEICLRSSEAADSSEADLVRKDMVDQFASFGVTTDDLKAYLGHAMRSINERELSGLRHVLNALRDGEATWPDFMIAKRGKRSKTVEAIAGRVGETQKREGRSRKGPGAAEPDAAASAPGEAGSLVEMPGSESTSPEPQAS